MKTMVSVIFLALFSVKAGAASGTDFAMFGPGVWPCNHYSAVRRQVDGSDDQREVVLWLVGYHRQLGTLDEIDLEQHRLALDYYCAAMPQEPVRCAVNELIRAEFATPPAIAANYVCRRSTLESLRWLRDRAGHARDTKQFKGSEK